MVFNSQKQQAQRLASALDQLELAPAGVEQPPPQQAAAAPAGSGAGEGVPGALPHQPQQQVDVVAAA